ncbi:mitochondrial fission 1 protein-like [Amphiura filiformis]|uniref:mitochondrial fission 1 protein-like n=1 Tax=Amphiura filiformis TaxID=82378 RepID=UPI003B2145A3
MESIVEETIPIEELKKFEQIYNAELARGKVTSRAQFQYAWCLTRSRYPNDIKKGTVLLEQQLQGGSQQIQRDCLFYLGVGYYRLKDYSRALKYVRGLLQIEPTNRQGLELEKLIKSKMQKEGIMGMAIVGGAVLGLAGLVTAGIALSKK